jgi:RNA polymerase-binding transcription factor DksA
MTIPALDPRAITTAEKALTQEASRRERQLAVLSTTGAAAAGDLVGLAHRASVERILTEVRQAQDRLAAGTYGDCLRCGSRIPAERLELRPWTAHCVTCASL